MRFNCGLTYLEKLELPFVFIRWFAWYPVRVGRLDCRWLEYVEMKEEWISSWGDIYKVRTYRLPA